MRGKPNPFISSEYTLLGLIYEKPTHGYDLHKQLTDPEGIGMIWQVKMSNLYAQLEKLVQKGYITGVVHPGDVHPNRTEYHITKDGKQAFESWLETTVNHPRDFRQEFMARYYFVLKYQPKKAAALCERQHEECKQWLANTLTAKQSILPQNAFKETVIEFRIAQIQSMVNWLNKLHIAIN
jgi:DNA-binding PadR family transcriptional regulator